jgi:phosphocarrier protein HPr
MPALERNHQQAGPARPGVCKIRWCRWQFKDPCTIRVGRTPETTVDGKSIMAMMMLAAGKGTKIYLSTEGEQEQEALDALVALINNYFDEGE